MEAKFAEQERGHGLRRTRYLGLEKRPFETLVVSLKRQGKRTAYYQGKGEAVLQANGQHPGLALSRSGTLFFLIVSSL
jgi:hypothetical protein